SRRDINLLFTITAWGNLTPVAGLAAVPQNCGNNHNRLDCVNYVCYLPRGGASEAEDQFGNIGGGQGATEQIALDLLHAGMGQHGFKLRLGLDPLCDDRQFEVPTDPGDAGQKPQGAWIGVDIGNEGAIDLEFGKRQGVEIAQRRITGAEIVE